MISIIHRGGVSSMSSLLHTYIHSHNIQALAHEAVSLRDVMRHSYEAMS